MIRPSMFNPAELVSLLLRSHRYEDSWRQYAEILHEDAPMPPRCLVRFGKNFLRHSRGPAQGCFWDYYGDNFSTPELALIALAEAPSPPEAAALLLKMEGPQP